MMTKIMFQLFLFTCLCIGFNFGVMIRNNALMSKMVSDFHGPKTQTVDIMRNVLCKRFPSIPCKLIAKDLALKKLIQRTIRLLSEKQRDFQNITTTTEQQTEFPVVNSDELSQYLAVENTGYFTDRRNTDNKEQGKKTTWSKAVDNRSKRRNMVPGHKNIKKYFPHKVKYKDRNEISDIDKSREKMSTSEEKPNKNEEKLERFDYKKERSNLPMWQIDYTKHGDPKLPNFSQESDQLRGKLVKIGADPENSGFKRRTGVLHPNVYIKNSAKRIQEY